MGARLVKDINPAGSSSPNELVSINGLLFFSAEIEPETPNPSTEIQPSSGVGLMRSDGSDEGTNILKLFESVSNLVKSGGKLYFIAGVNNQYQLWSSDGTSRGTKQVKDLYPNADPNFPQDLFEIDGVLFYSAIDGASDNGKYPYVNGYEVWRREGNAVGSRFFRNLIPDKVISDIDISSEGTESTALDENGDPIELTKRTTVNTKIGLNGITTITTTIEDENYINGEIVKTTTTSTEQRETTPNDLKTEDVTQSSEVLTEADKDGNIINQYLLYTTTTTTRVVDVQSGLITTTTKIEKDNVVNGTIKTSTTTSTKEEVITGGDLEGNTFSEEKIFATTTDVTNTAKVTTSVYENDSFPKDFIGINGNYFFTAQSNSLYSLETSASDTLIGGLELWFSDGTEAGTRPININQKTYTFYEPEDGEYTPAELLSNPEFGFKEQSSSSFPRQLTPSRDNLFFVANDGIAGFELWSITDQGTKASLISDLNPGNTSSSPEELTVVGKNLYFSADQGSGRKLFYYNNSFKKPKLVKNSGDNPESLTAIGKQLYYSAESELGRELWSAKNSKGMMVADINTGSESSSPNDMTMVTRIIKDKSKKRTSKYLYFTADDGSHGTEIMSINLKAKKRKVTIDTDIIDGPSSSFPRELINHGQQLYFTAKNRSIGRELWTVGPAIEGPTGDPGASSSEANIFENQTFVYNFSITSPQKSVWEINGGADASQFKIDTNSGKLSFKSAPKYNNPRDKNEDNIYEVFVRSTIKNNGYDSDQFVSISVANIDEDSGADTSRPEANGNNSGPNGTNSSDDILFYTKECGPMTANGPLYPCNQEDTASDSDTDSGPDPDPITGSDGSASGSSNSIPTVTGNNLSADGKENYNNYNDNVDSYNEPDIEGFDDCNFASSARFWAVNQLDENDDTLATHYNQYFSPACNASQIII
jgi:ELWxxDGT repeat protein